jgi:hypothetical protein
MKHIGCLLAAFIASMGISDQDNRFKCAGHERTYGPRQEHHRGTTLGKVTHCTGITHSGSLFLFLEH